MGYEMGKIIVVMKDLLDLSKIVMYGFHYGYMTLKYDENLRLC